MFFSLLLATMLALDPSQQEAPAADLTHAEAVQAAEAGRDAEALAAFQRLASMNPNDREARLWIARLHARMGHQQLAEPVYRSVLLEDQGSVEAMLGVGSALVARDEPREAIEVLEVAEELDPNNGEVLALLGRAYEQAGRTADAISYFERADSAAPNARHRRSLEAARLSYLHRLELRGSNEQLSGGGADNDSGDLTLNLRVNEKWRVVGRGQVQRKFGVSERRGGAGVEWGWKRATTLRAHALVGSDAQVMPEGDFLGEVEHTYEGATWTGTIRHFDFTGASTTIFSPGVAWMAREGVSVALRYALSWTEAGATDQAGQSALARAAFRIYPRVWLQGGYAAGVEDFENFSIERIGDFRANTLSGGFRIDLPTLTALVANFERQWQQERDVTLSRVTVSIHQRF